MARVTQLGGVPFQTTDETYVTQVGSGAFQQTPTTFVTQIAAVYIYRLEPPDITTGTESLQGSSSSGVECPHGSYVIPAVTGSVGTDRPVGSAAAMTATGSASTMTVSGSV